MASISYTPEPHEQAYYGSLFRAADVKGTRNIGGAEAVQFFARSKLPVDVLKNIWTVADQPSTSSLDPPKFAVALRLIQLTQNGQKGQGPNLAVPPGVQLRPVFFEGVSGVTVPMPGTNATMPMPGQQPQQPGPQVSPTPHQPQREIASPGRGHLHPPTPQQHQQRPPMSPQRVPGSSPPSMLQQQQLQQQLPPTPNSRALVGQDPYMMTPQERSRYEGIFPDYARPDGYVYGQEAVALFSKSGVGQSILRDIWNMVDLPVDNRLDKLEFAMAMHLIVCISKKNLPPPQGGTLPNSLLALKSSQSPPTPVSTSSLEFHVQAAPSPSTLLPQQMQQQTAQQPRMQQPPQVETVEETPIVRPLPIVTGGALSISDAFEGLSLTSPLPSPRQQYGSSAPNPPPIESRSFPAHDPEISSVASEAIAPIDDKPKESYSYQREPVTSAPAPEPAPAANTPTASFAPSSSYDIADAHSELDKLKSILQKLQAENISLKAQLGNMSSDEKAAHKDLGAVVTEIGKLSSELSVYRQQVLDAKNRLLEASAELKAQKEHKVVLTDLISEAKQTKEVIEEATASLENASHAAVAVETKKEEAMMRSDMFETNLFGYDGSGAGSAMGEMPAPSLATDRFTKEPSGGMSALGSTADYENTGRGSSEPPRMYGGFNASSPAPQAEAPSTPQPAYQPPQQQQLTPTNLNRPPPVDGHNRQSSGFDSGFLMGGSAVPISEPSVEQKQVLSASRSHSSSGDYGFEDEEAFKIVEDMKRKAERAAEVARDAEAAANRLASEADELRTDADKAEANARTLRAAADEQKKGRFGGGKKKTMVRDAERAAHDAVEIKKRFMAVQTQAHDAATLATETRREADRLKNEAEKAEIEMASAASLRDQQNSSSQAVEAPASSNGYGMPPTLDSGAGSYGGAHGYGQIPSQNQGYYGGFDDTGYGRTTAPMNGGGEYSKPYGSSGYSSYPSQYGAGVMGGGGSHGFDLPSPHEFEQSGGTND